MTDLKVNTTDLREAGSALRYVATEFEHADSTAHDFAEVVGHSGLADKLRSFADNWDDNRKQLLESIQGLAEAAVAAGELYEEIESELVKALTEGAS